MKQEHLLLEQVTLAEEILDRGSGDGRGVRLAALVLRLNEHVSSGGELPCSWRPPSPPFEGEAPESLEDLMRSVDEAWGEGDGVPWLSEDDYELIE